MSVSDEQQFCLRWNNFQANITSQFETLRDDEDFTDVTIACEGQRIQAHKVVLSACSPFFKELFKTNPCTHPIIFMRDVEVQHVVALMEFMYAGEVNVAQAHLSAFLKTAESLKIRGLTDTSSPPDPCKEREEDSVFLPSSKQYSSFFTKQTRPVKPQISSTSNVTSSQDIPASPDKSCTPPPKKQCKNERNETELPRLKQLSTINEDSISVNPFTLQCDDGNLMEVSKSPLLPKMELPDYLSDDDRDEAVANFYHSADVTELTGGMEIIPQTSNLLMKENNIESNAGTDSRKLHSLDPRPCDECGRVYSNLSNLRQHMKLIHYPTYVQCPICQKDFKTDLYLRRHMQGSHELGKFSINEKYRSHSTPYASNSGNYKCSHKMPDQKFSVSQYHTGSVSRLQ